MLRLLYDAHGSTRDVLDVAAGRVAAGLVQRYAYDAYGRDLGLPATVFTGLRYAGESIDPLTGLSFNRARWYDSNQGRFKLSDPWKGVLQEPLTLNKYAYSHSNPISGSDPSGNNLVSTLVTVGVLGGLVFGLMYGMDIAFRAHFSTKAGNIAGQGVGGPDITAYLKAMDSYITQQAANADAPPIAWDWDDWDIRVLAKWGQPYYAKQGAPGVLDTSSGLVSTVTVDGKVYRPEEVNYYLYGVWLRVSNTSLSWGERKVVIYRLGQWAAPESPDAING